MNWEPLNILEGHSMAFEKLVQCGQGKIAEVFVIDSVEFAALNHLLDVRDLDDSYAIILQDNPQTLDYPIQIGYMGQNIVRVNDVSSPILGNEFPCQILSKVFTNGENAAFFLCHTCDIVRGLYA